MNTFTSTLACACIALAAGTANAQDTTKKSGSMGADGMMKKDMTMQECKDHMAMAKKDGMKRDDAMKGHDAMCSDMMKKGGMHKDGMKDGMHKDTMKKAPMSGDPMTKESMPAEPMKK